MKNLKLIRSVYLLTLLALLLVIGLSCGERPEKIAGRLAQEWTSSSIDKGSDSLAGAATGNIPGVQQLVASVISNQVRTNVTWSYSKPSKLSDGQYEVVATATAPVSFKVRVVEQSYGLSAEFPLTIDTKNKKVVYWKFGAFRFAKR